MIKKSFSIFLFVSCLHHVGFTQTTPSVSSLKGKWQYAGGVYNGAKSDTPKDYKMQRVYTDKDFAAFASQTGYRTERYEAGNYVLKGDSCYETSTFSSRPSQLVGKTVAYGFSIHNGQLVFSGKLPTGMIVEEHWQKIK